MLPSQKRKKCRITVSRDLVNVEGLRLSMVKSLDILVSFPLFCRKNEREALLSIRSYVYILHYWRCQWCDHLVLYKRSHAFELQMYEKTLHLFYAISYLLHRTNLLFISPVIVSPFICALAFSPTISLARLLRSLLLWMFLMLHQLARISL